LQDDGGSWRLDRARAILARACSGADVMDPELLLAVGWCCHRVDHGGLCCLLAAREELAARDVRPSNAADPSSDHRPLLDWILLLGAAAWLSRHEDRGSEATVARSRLLADLALRGRGEIPAERRVLILAGDSLNLTTMQQPHPLQALIDVLASFHGVVISGGTNQGIPGAAARCGAALAGPDGPPALRIGYVPRTLPPGVELASGYHRIVRSDGSGFGPQEPLLYWTDILLAHGTTDTACLVGIGGGELSGFEYRLALALGARVGLVDGSGGAVEALAADPDWRRFPELVMLPSAAAVVRSFIAGAI
jgi:hypothetical protein